TERNPGRITNAARQLTGDNSTCTTSTSLVRLLAGSWMVMALSEYSYFNVAPSPSSLTADGLAIPLSVTVTSSGGSRSSSYAPPFLNCGRMNRERVEAD